MEIETSIETNIKIFFNKFDKKFNDIKYKALKEKKVLENKIWKQVLYHDNSKYKILLEIKKDINNFELLEFIEFETFDLQQNFK